MPPSVDAWVVMERALYRAPIDLAEVIFGRALGVRRGRGVTG